MGHTNLEIWDASNFGVPYIVTDNDVTIAHFYGENAYENAKAFKASKDMYEALEILTGEVGRSPKRYSGKDKLEIAKKALQKAKGEDNGRT